MTTPETYVLVAVGRQGEETVLGRHHTYRRALRARADDVVAQLVANQGRRLRVEHRIVGPGLDGPRTVHALCTELGDDSPSVGPAALIEARAWVMALHRS